MKPAHGYRLEDQADRVGLRYAYEGGFDVSKAPALWERFARRYAERLKAQPDRWDFLTGPQSTIYNLSRNGFKLAVSDGSEEAGIPVHSTRLILVDRHGDIRGYYDAIEADAMTKLLADTNHLLREQPKYFGEEPTRPASVRWLVLRRRQYANTLCILRL